MAKVKQVLWRVASFEKSSMKTYIDSLCCPLVTTSLESRYYDNDTLVMSIDGHGTLKYSIDSEYKDRTTFYIDFDNGYSWYAGRYMLPDPRYNQYTLTSVCNDKVFYLRFDGNSWGYRSLMFLYSKLSNDRYLVGGAYPGFAPAPLSAIEMHSNDATQGIFTYTNTLNYTASGNKIYYCAQAALCASVQSVTTKFYDDPNFIACSTVPLDKAITFKGQNYYSISDNLLVPMDKEPNNG